MLLRRGLPRFFIRCKDTAKNRSVQENREKSTQILRKEQIPLHHSQKSTIFAVRKMNNMLSKLHTILLYLSVVLLAAAVLSFVLCNIVHLLLPNNDDAVHYAEWLSYVLSFAVLKYVKCSPPNHEEKKDRYYFRFQKTPYQSR